MNSLGCGSSVRSGHNGSCRQPRAFTRIVSRGLELQCDSMLEVGEARVCGLSQRHGTLLDFETGIEFE